MSEKFIGVVLARKNSQRLKNKNLLKIGKYALTEYPLIALYKSKLISYSILSSDSLKILRLGKKYSNCLTQFRPKKYSGNRSSSIDALKYIIKKNQISSKDYIVLLEPTSPLTNFKDVDKAILKLKKSKYHDSLVSVGKCKSIHPDFCFTLKNNNSPLRSKIMPDIKNTRDFFYLDGSLYISKISKLIDNNTFLHKKTLCVEFDKVKNLEIDDKEDFNIIKKFL